MPNLELHTTFSSEECINTCLIKLGYQPAIAPSVRFSDVVQGYHVHLSQSYLHYSHFRQQNHLINAKNKSIFQENQSATSFSSMFQIISQHHSKIKCQLRGGLGCFYTNSGSTICSIPSIPS